MRSTAAASTAPVDIEDSVMKKFLICMLSLTLLLACVPTPQQEVVVNKADGTLEEIIHATAAPDHPTWTMPSEPGATTPAPTAGRLAMETVVWTDSFSVAAAMDRLDVNIDATVQVPTSGTASVLRIGFAPPEDSQMQALIRLFLGDGTIYLADTTKTKAYYKAQMERYVAEKERETNERNRQEWDTLLKMANEAYAKAPDEQAPVVWDGQTSGGVRLMSANGDGTYRYLKANAEKLLYEDSLDTPYLIRNRMKSAPETDEETAAVALCESVLKSLGIDAVFSELCDTQNSIRAFGEREVDGFLVCFTPLYGGLPVTEVRTFNGFDEAIHAAGGNKEPTYSIQYEDETIEFVVENGRIVTFRYVRPSRLRKVENEAAALLPFYQIKELFKKDIGKVLFVNKGQPMKLTVHTVRLTMQRYPIRDTQDELYLLPCWEFLASIDSGNSVTDASLTNVCVLRLNALDGSILS